MYRFIIAVLLLGFFALSCGKKEDAQTIQKITPLTDQRNPKTNNQPGTTGNKSSSPGEFYFVNNVGHSGGKKDFVDFSWSENDKVKKLSDLKGKVIVLNFWATWCPPCKKELPALSEISREFEGKDFQMIGISVDENPDALVNFLKSNALPYTILHENAGLLEKYMSVSGNSQSVIPQTFIISKDGKVVENIVGSRSKSDFVSIINKYM